MSPRLHPLIPSDRAFAVLALLVTTALWATSFIAAEIALTGFPPVTLALLRCVTAYLFLRPCLRRGDPAPVSGRSVLVLGLTGVALPIVCHNLALRWSESADATLLHNGTLPVLTSVLAALVLGERLGGRLCAGIAASLAGVTIATASSGAHLDAAAAGGGLIVAGTAAFAVYTVVGRRAFATNAWLPLVAGTMRAAALLLLPLAIAELAIGGVPHPTPASLAALLYLGAGCSGLALALNGLALRRLEAGRVAVIGNLVLPLGFVAGAALLGESVGGAELGGAGLISAGAWFASRTDGATDAPPPLAAPSRRRHAASVGKPA